MASQTPQSYSNHTRYDPAFHFVVIPILFATVIVGVVHALRQPNFYNLWLVIFFLAVLMAAFLIRTYAAKVQDRVIRLEERLRLAQLVDASLRPQLGRLSERQLIALRFASDEEAPALVDRTLAENLAPAEIKKAIRNWRADNWRV
ncbi:MAG TPA: DUF6526 family protein [Bryobacteraceae bacterium]|nr:DUF6526 family protein [Bryobacteraceae bacterium]